MLLMLIHVFSLQKNFQIELLSLRKSARKSSYLYLRNIGNDSMPSRSVTKLLLHKEVWVVEGGIAAQEK